MNAIIILSLLLKVAVSIEQIPDADDQLHIYALPVGQGDCTVIQCPRASRFDTKGLVTIIDAGAMGNRAWNGQDIVNFLDGTRPNFIVLTHRHADHRSYVDDILNLYKKKVTVYHSCDWEHYDVNSQYAKPKRIRRCVGIKDCEKRVLEKSLCPSDRHVTLSFVASAVGECAFNHPNRDSIISKITYAGRSTLITGDFELTKNGMRDFLNTAGPDLHSDIYKLSHHGSNKANSERFLDAVDARYLFSSSGFRYGHPRCEIAKYYRKRLPENARVPDHPYTCFYRYGNKYKSSNENTVIPIYVTSVYREGFQFTKEFYLLIKFNINKYGLVTVNWKYLNQNNWYL